ncbi:hypothetical protein KP79_PYT25661 [Mizuhopecten yessoensis]|uniref:Endonuclease/exonuclease/phosphatase domain-containing protein n=1 Tax=Mizuhopecten yessoensis TaxID=6573 RepID=A0A210QPL2_MIZYE|nr:hypothetical protein KP79_PYT25661 [Mizuhopecten yessoensis]
MCRQLGLDQVDIECVGVHVQDLDASLVVVYRPESYTASVFLEQLHQLLLLLAQNGKATIIAGYFNQDVLKSESSIKKCMEQHGSRQLMDRSTTDGGTLIDHVYMCRKLQASFDKMPAYYSYHDIVSVQVQIP